MLFMGIVDDFYLQPIILAKLKQRKFWQENAPDGRYRYDHIAALLIHGFSWTVMMLTPLWWYGLLPSGWMFVTAIAANTIIHAQVASCRDAPLGRKPLPLAFASRRDAPLGAERGIPTGCHDFFTLFPTERNIPAGCWSDRGCNMSHEPIIYCGEFATTNNKSRLDGFKIGTKANEVTV